MQRGYVGIMADATPELVIGLLGILESGNAFVPVNPRFPTERVQVMIEDLGIKVLLADRANYQKARQVEAQTPRLKKVICIDEAIDLAADSPGYADSEKEDIGCRGELPFAPTDLAYVIYTSGSTGNPKGVPISHENLFPLLYWARDYFPLNAGVRVLQNLSYTFDFGVFEILTTLFFGGVVYQVEQQDVGDFTRFADLIDKYAIDTLHTTPAFCAGLAAVGRELPTLKTLHLGGERLSARLVKDMARLLPDDCRIHNGYGPTETSINSSIFSLGRGQVEALGDEETIPIGRPSAFNRLYILDRWGNVQPRGVAGELCIGGPGLSRGYLNNPELTAEKFVFSPLTTHHSPITNHQSPITNRLYRTGDLCRWLDDGNIEFLGRIDFQVKIRGFRIELHEIENCLLSHPAIEAAAVTVWPEDGRNTLCVHFVGRSQKPGQEPSFHDVRSFLARKLPDYMIPAYFVRLDSLPLNPSGKVDRKALQRPAKEALVNGAGYVPPANETEERLLKIWQDILGIGQIGVEDDFFELGGDSILAGRCIAQVREELRLDISLRKMFELPTIRGLAREAAPRERAGLIIPRAPRDSDIPLSFPQERLWFLHNLDKSNMAYFVPRAIRIRGKLDVTLLGRTFSEIIRRHEILRTVFPTRQGRPVQKILPPFPVRIPVIDLNDVEGQAQSEMVSAWILAEGQRRFDLEKGPLIRVNLLVLGPGEHILVLTEHHLVHDGWTQEVLLKEFIAIFTAFYEGRPCPLPDLPIQYADFAVWQRNLMQGETLAFHLDYWKKKLAGLPPVLDLPIDFPRPAMISGRGEMKNLVVSPELTADLKKFSRQEGVTLFMTMLAAFKVLLFRTTGVGDICIGIGIANRRLKELEGMLGMIINTLALRTQLDGNLSFRESLHRVKLTCLEAYEHEDTPFEKVVEALRPERSLSFNPVFQVLYTFMDVPTGDMRLPDLELNLQDSHNRSAKFDFNLVVVPPLETADQAGEMLVEWEYSSDLFFESTIDRLLDLYRGLLEEIISRPDDSISDLSLAGNREQGGGENQATGIRMQFDFQEN